MAFWSCAQLVPHRVELALDSLKLAGFPTYVPRLRVERKTQPELLFPNYIFVTIIEGRWHAAQRAPGVLKILLHDDRPVKVPDRVIEELRQREGDDGLITLPSPLRLRRGSPIKITAGPFSGKLAIFANSKPRQRIECLLSLLGSPRSLVLPRAHIASINPRQSNGRA